MAELLEVIGQCDFFKKLDPAAQAQVVNAGIIRRFQPKTYILHEGEAASHFHIIIEGRVKLTQITPEGHQIIVTYMGPGNGLGIIVALSNMDYPLSAEVVELCTTLLWDQATTEALMRRYPQLAINGMRMVAHQFKALSNRYRELATERVERRIARALLRLLRHAGRDTGEGVLIDMPLSRQDVAELTGTTLFTVSRMLRGWEDAGIVRLGREQVIIVDAHRLIVIAEDLPQRFS